MAWIQLDVIYGSGIINISFITLLREYDLWSFGLELNKNIKD
jgi:hypothetical protein